jgi:hypothetical protein
MQEKVPACGNTREGYYQGVSTRSIEAVHIAYSIISCGIVAHPDLEII